MKTHFAFATASLLLTAFSQAATLSLSNAVPSGSNAQININSFGALDWTIWKKAGSANAAGAAPSDSRSGGTAISDLYSVGGGTAGFRASTNSTPNWDFVFTGGTPTASGTVSDVNGVFHPDTGSAGKGVGLTVTLPTTNTYIITLFVAGFNTTTQLTASLAGATALTNSTFTPVSNDPKSMAYFQITATADAANSPVTLEIINTALSNPSLPGSGIDANGHVMISAVAVQLIPEPTTAVMGLISAATLAFRRRRILS